MSLVRECYLFMQYLTNNAINLETVERAIYSLKFFHKLLL